MASPAQAGDTGRESDGAVSSDSAPPVASLYAKIAEVMAEVGYVAKRGRNDFHKYTYATEADVLEAVRDKLAARHVAIVPALQSIEERPYETRQGKPSVITTARIAYTFLDGDSGETLTAEWAGQGDDPADKGLYKAMTGSAKYFLMKTFLIPTGDDPEGDKGADERGANRTQRPAQPPKPPLEDERAKALMADIDAEVKAIHELPGGQEAMPLGRVNAWKADAQHSHEIMEQLVGFLRERKGEIEAEREVTG